MVRRRMVLQQPLEVHPIFAGFLDLSAGKDPLLIRICHYLEHNPWFHCRFPSLGRIRFIQIRIIQFLKLGAGQSDGFVLR